MACQIISGPRMFDLSRDKEGHRTYNIAHLVEGTPGVDGVFSALNTPGLPAIGSFWNFLSETDIWAYCTAEASVKVHGSDEGHKPKIFKVSQVFTTKPYSRCQDDSIEDPLLEPQKISGSFIKTTVAATVDKDDEPIETPTGEVINNMEFDENRPTVRIEQNVTALGLATFAEMVDKVNVSPLWGLPVRCIKLSNVSWSRKVYGTCDYYYTRTFDFDVNFNTFDKTVYPRCEEVKGHWSVLDSQAATWVTTTDLERYFAKGHAADVSLGIERKLGQPAKTYVDANGERWDGTGAQPSVLVQKYKEADFTTLGIPITW